MLLPSIFRNNYSDDLFDDLFYGLSQSQGTTGVMSTDIQEFDNMFSLKMELPGYSKEDVNAELKDGYLIVTAERNENKDEKDKAGRWVRRERFTGKCQRSFYVGKGVKEEDIKAGFQDGVLRIDVPKPEQKPAVETKRYIPIE